MPLPVLRRYNVQGPVADAWADITPVVPAGRALVIGKLAIQGRIANTGGGFGLRVWDGATERLYCFDQPLGLGEIFTESGIVLVAGDKLQLYSRIANSYVASAFGEEVDNG